MQPFLEWTGAEPCLRTTTFSWVSLDCPHGQVEARAMVIERVVSSHRPLLCSKDRKHQSFGLFTVIMVGKETKWIPCWLTLLELALRIDQ